MSENDVTTTTTPTIKKEEQKQDDKQQLEQDAEALSAADDPLLNDFYSEIDDIKGVDLKTTAKEQINRLLRPGSTYFNLNPFDVLQIDPYTPLEDVKKKYRKLSMYVHPDKNKDDVVRAQQAFEALNKAYKTLEDEKERKRCLEIVDEARERVEKMVNEKRKKLKKEGKADAKIEEDDPDKYRHAVYVQTCKLFADVERVRVKETEKVAEEKKRRAVDKDVEESKSKIKKEWDKNYEESRQGRVNSWKDFKTKTKISTFKPPKHKPESR